MFDIGAMVKARGRDWVVLPGSDKDFLILKPLGGSDAEITGLYAGAGGETVQAASFDLPLANAFGSASGAKLMVSAAKLAIRSGAGPFRSLGRLGFEPRSYQLVPLLMALRQTPARLLIADDVGIGKTVEAALIARELFDRGEITRFAVLCPPHLCGQWVVELSQKFGLEAASVLPNTTKRLERDCNVGQSIFERYPFVVVSLDLVKSERWREDFLRHAPELIIVDEAHASADNQSASQRHQRYSLLEKIAADPERHLLLVTATPHSGKEEAFTSLLKLLNPELAAFSLEQRNSNQERIRTILARHLVQRGRKDVQQFLQQDTPFPQRLDSEIQYHLHPEYARLFADVLEYARESVQVMGETQNRTRIRWWAALGLLRALSSSPQAAAATLRERALNADETNPDLIEALGRELVFDPDSESDNQDLGLGAQTETDQNSPATLRLLELAKRAEGLIGEADYKLVLLTKQIQQLIKEGFAPIVFCRFIASAEAVAAHLATHYKQATVGAVTGRLTPDERMEAVQRLTEAETRVLVATDCLSEGINLQHGFNAVIHYDLPWNPTRLDQREGRVDRYGQRASTVKVLTLYSQDNRIDQLILDVLVRKHRKIRETLGTSIPAPEEAESLLDTLLARLLEQQNQEAVQLPLLPEVEAFETKWRNAAEGEKKSRSRFAQNTIRPEEVSQELEDVRLALGDHQTTKDFVLGALQGAKVIVTPKPDGSYQTDPSQIDVRPEFKDFLSSAKTFRFDTQLQAKVQNLGRNHPLIEQLSSTVLGQALEQPHDATAKRVGVIRCAVPTQTTLLLLRHRFHLSGRKGNRTWQTLSEELDFVAFTGRSDNPTWLDPIATQALLELEPLDNLSATQKEDRLTRTLSELSLHTQHLSARAAQRATTLLEAHERVRGAAKGLGVTYGIEPPTKPDVLGVYIFLPVPNLGVAS